MNHRFTFLAVVSSLAICLSAHAQSWSTFLDPSRAIDWTSAGFTIPSYSVACATQPTLASGSSAASANATAIQNALASCDSTHNVVNLPAGTYYVTGITFPAHGNQVLRGAGADQTELISTSQAGCFGANGGICMISTSPIYAGSSQVLAGGSQQCQWTGGLTQGSTTITLSSCGGAPPVNHMLVLDQAVDSADTGGTYICNSTSTGSCNADGAGSTDGRTLSGVNHGELQITYITGVTSLGGGSYTVTISPAVYNTNIRSSQSPGAWWSDITTLNGLENLTVDGTSDSNATVTMYDCYQCWVKGVTLLNGARGSVQMNQSLKSVIRDSYFYQAQGHAQVSYNIDPELSDGWLIENNIFQQVTMPIGVNQGSGGVFAYNFSIDNIAFSGWTWTIALSHNASNNFNLWEGNITTEMQGDDMWGSSVSQTMFRNSMVGWSTNGSSGTVPLSLRSYDRAFNFIGNVLGEPGYHTQYQTYATSSTAGTGAGSEYKSIYSLGWAQTGPTCGNGTAQSNPYCDPLVYSTLMRWGNYDVVHGATQWDSTEASPAAVTYINANFTSSYFGSLAHTLPASLHYNTTPSWWPSGKAWPTVGPDITSGNVGICSGGTYAGYQATSSSQCTGGTLIAGWGSLVNSNPAMDCYLNTMGGPPDGSGSALTFNASACYATSGTTSGGTPGAPTGLTATLQ